MSHAGKRVLVSESLPEGWLDELEGWCDAQGHRLEIGIPAGAEEHGDVIGILTMLTVPVDRALLDRLPNLRVVSNMAVGHDNVDVAACRARQVDVGNTPGVLTAATADLTMALLLASARNLERAVGDARAGRWQTWTPTGWLGRDLEGATLGIVGLGKIGEAVARRAAGFGLQLRYSSRTRRPDIEDELGIAHDAFDELLRQADFLSLHVPLSDATRHLIGREQLRMMKSSAHLINTARGLVVDQDALVDALRERWIGGAALDVTTPEPLPPEHALFGLGNCLVAPHIGSSTERTRRSMARLACRNLIAGLESRPLPHRVA